MKEKKRVEKLIKELILKDDELLELTTAIEGPIGFENINKYGILTCELCLYPLKRKEITLDHKIPKMLDGKTNIKNLQLAHADCNKKKGSAIWL